ncbi:amidase [Thalassobaculum fulvum]|uniref:Amidase n=1 Tax=Thalassobaculum fulvum TaxID=1633335 RepID=A0A919CRN2_9PROT|nr:amidase [Thalassobaculum fulvum]GHD58640.1 amidase [Thalassobaculum fulvum]
MPDTDLALWSATELLHGYASRTVSPVEATRAALARIDAHNDRLNAFCLVDAESALAAARDSEARWAKGAPKGLVDGVPTSIKDLSLTKGWPTMRGSKAVDPKGPWDVDAPFVARLREHGAVLLGKTTTPEFGWKGVTDNALTGVTRNPWDPSKTPGGSSGGAAVAAATGMGALHQGSDGGGSIRMPAGYTGVYGIKPTFGRVPAYPLSPFGTVAHVGPMTRTVADSALMMTVMQQPDARDWYAAPADTSDLRRAAAASVKGWRIAFCPTLGNSWVDPEVAALVKAAAEAFVALGAIVEEIDSPLADSHETFRKHWYTGAANLFTGFSAEQKALIDPGLQQIAAEGAEIGLLDYFAAVKEREAMGTAMNLFHEKYDVLLTPTLPQPAFEAGHEVPPGSTLKRWTEWTPYSYPFNLTQQPAASIPCGLTKAGLPVGLHIVGPKHRDDMVLTASAAYETVRPVALPKL